MHLGPNRPANMRWFSVTFASICFMYELEAWSLARIHWEQGLRTQLHPLVLSFSKHFVVTLVMGLVTLVYVGNDEIRMMTWSQCSFGEWSRLIRGTGCVQCLDWAYSFPCRECLTHPSWTRLALPGMIRQLDPAHQGVLGFSWRQA